MQVPILDEAFSSFVDLLNWEKGHTGILERFKTGSEGEGSGNIHRTGYLRVNAVLFSQIEVTCSASELWYHFEGITSDEFSRAILMLDDADQILVEQSLFDFIGKFADEVLTSHDTVQCIRSEYLGHAGQPEADSRDHKWIRTSGC